MRQRGFVGNLRVRPSSNDHRLVPTSAEERGQPSSKDACASLAARGPGHSRTRLVDRRSWIVYFPSSSRRNVAVEINALTSRAVGSWLIGIGVFAIHSTWERDYARVRAGALSYLAFGLLELVALARFSSNVSWDALGTWMYTGFVLSVVLIGLYLTVSFWKDSRRPNSY
jgi:hypothetical protein